MVNRGFVSRHTDRQDEHLYVCLLYTSSPAGITDKLIIDATTPVAPDNRGHYSQPVVDLPETKAWAEKLTAMLAARQ